MSAHPAAAANSWDAVARLTTITDADYPDPGIIVAPSMQIRHALELVERMVRAHRFEHEAFPRGVAFRRSAVGVLDELASSTELSAAYVCLTSVVLSRLVGTLVRERAGDTWASLDAAARRERMNDTLAAHCKTAAGWYLDADTKADVEDEDVVRLAAAILLPHFSRETPDGSD